jgi:hypothetical protein
MKYFTPELLAQLDSTDAATANAADAEWDRRLEEYEAALQRLSPEMPAHIREFNQLLLHDARVESIARHGNQLVMVLHKDVPPRQVVILTYDLTEEPLVNAEALPPGQRSPVMDFLYDELDLVRDGDQHQYTQSILFGNGWEMRLCFRDVRVTLAEPIYPVPSGEVAGRLPQPLVSFLGKPSEGTRE